MNALVHIEIWSSWQVVDGFVRPIRSPLLPAPRVFTAKVVSKKRARQIRDMQAAKHELAKRVASRVRGRLARRKAAR